MPDKRWPADQDISYKKGKQVPEIHPSIVEMVARAAHSASTAREDGTDDTRLEYLNIAEASIVALQPVFEAIAREGKAQGYAIAVNGDSFAVAKPAAIVSSVLSRAMEKGK